MKTDSSNYAISFHFVKRNGISKDNLKGTHSFELEFAVKDNENKLSWKIDGWQRLTTLNGIIHGSVCDLGLYYFEAEKEKEYEAKLHLMERFVSLREKVGEIHKLAKEQAQDPKMAKIDEIASEILEEL